MNRPADSAAHERLTIAGLLEQVRAAPKTFVAAVVLTIAAVVSYAYLATPVYRGTVKMMPRENDVSGAGGGLQGILGQFGGLAALAGISLGSVNEQESIAWLKSRALFTLFVNERNLLPILFDDEWDAKAGRWRSDLRRQPTMDDAWSMFDHLRRVNDDPKTRVITLEINWKDRHQAADWANELVRLANDELRKRALRESDASIASLQEQLAHADAVELRQSIYKLMEVQVNRSVLAKSRAEYALTVLDPAVVSDARRFVSPRRFLLLVISLPLALFVGACAVVTSRFVAELAAQMRRPRS